MNAFGHTNFRRVTAIAASLVVVAFAGATVESASATPAQSVVPAVADPTFTLMWDHSYGNSGTPGLGSAGVGYLDGNGPSVIVGSSGGTARAINISTGNTVTGWPFQASTAGFSSTPSVSGTGASAGVYFGLGISNKPYNGGYLALTGDGKYKWFRAPHLVPSNSSRTRGVMSSLAVGNLQTGNDVVGGAMGQMQLAMRADNGSVLKGFPWLMADTNFSTPALAAVYPTLTTRDFIIEGGDSTKGVADFKPYANGGHIRILRPTGWYGRPYRNDGLMCQYNTNQVVQSSPAVGTFLAPSAPGGGVGVVVGTGHFYSNASDTGKLIAIDLHCALKWKVALDGRSESSPALADVTGTGSLDVVTVSSKGTVYALNGENGAELWHNTLNDTTEASVTTFQAPGGAYQFVLVPTYTGGVYVLDGRDGHEVAHLFGTPLLRSAVTVTADLDGHIGITVAGNSGGQTRVQHYVVDGTSGVTTVQTPGSWPMFHHDPQLTGYAKEWNLTS